MLFKHLEISTERSTFLRTPCMFMFRCMYVILYPLTLILHLKLPSSYWTWWESNKRRRKQKIKTKQQNVTTFTSYFMDHVDCSVLIQHVSQLNIVLLIGLEKNKNYKLCVLSPNWSSFGSFYPQLLTKLF